MVCQGCLSLRHGAQAPAEACLTIDKLSTGTRCSCRSAERNTMSCKPWPFVQREHVTSAVQCSFVGRRLGSPAAASSLCCEAQVLKSDGKSCWQIDVVSKRCESEGCDIHANFGHAHGERPRFCSAHKLPGMVRPFGPRISLQCRISCRCIGHVLRSFFVQVNTSHLRCEADGCSKYATHGVRLSAEERRLAWAAAGGSPGPAMRFCVAHAPEGVVRGSTQSLPPT